MSNKDVIVKGRTMYILAVGYERCTQPLKEIVCRGSIEECLDRALLVARDAERLHKRDRVARNREFILDVLKTKGAYEESAIQGMFLKLQEIKLHV